MINEEDLKEYRENGRKLFRSAENLRSSSVDLSALMESLEKVLSKGGIGDVRDAKDAEIEDSDWTDWFNCACSRNKDVRNKNPGKKGPASVVGTLTYIVRLCGAENATEQNLDWPWMDQTCLIMGWHKEKGEYWWIEFFDPNNSEAENICHHGNGLWGWQDTGYEDAADAAYYGGFFFALPIFALRNESDLMKFVLEPLKILFEADHPHTVAAEALAGVPVLTPAAG
jgi:hypothetical protein